jgi:hypothetical protein
MNVVDPSSRVRYAALSYMWPAGGLDDITQLEKANVSSLEARGGLLMVSLPAIISDAISLCRDLGERFLWCDRLCIVQDDPDSKHGQIERMDEIYNSAEFAIIAALNHRSDMGLPGYTDRRSAIALASLPRVFDVETRGIRRTWDNDMKLVNESLWNKRGWTFQERVLSPRRLYITESQVIFECQSGRAIEDVTHYLPPRVNEHGIQVNLPYDDPNPGRKEDENLRGFSPPPSSSGHRDKYCISDSTSLMDYFDWVEDHTSRQLSFETDILNAFAGVGNALSRSLSTGMIYGLPEKYISQALLWICKTSFRRRISAPNIPSWSWASWKDGSSYYGPKKDGQEVAKAITLVYYYFQDFGRGLRKLEAQERWVADEVTIEEVAMMNEVPDLPKTQKYLSTALATNNTWSGCPHNPREVVSHRKLNQNACALAATMPGALVFNTTVASLTLERHDVEEVFDGSGFEAFVHICLPDGERIGRLNVRPETWFQAYPETDIAYNFIVISGGLLDSRVREQAYMATLSPEFRRVWFAMPAEVIRKRTDLDFWELNVMLVEKDNSRPDAYVAKRIATGSVWACRWKDCNSRWETVVLM